MFTFFTGIMGSFVHDRTFFNWVDYLLSFLDSEVVAYTH